jgi:hypothetical protein
LKKEMGDCQGKKINRSMVEYKSRFHRNLELWFDEPESDGNYDVVVRFRSLKQGTRGKSVDFYNLHVDLSKETEDIFNKFARNTRAQIKKSLSQDEFSVQFLDKPNKSELMEFANFYNSFADSRKFPKIYMPRLLGYLDSDTFSLSAISHKGKVLTWHSNMHFGHRIGLMQSVSHFRMEDEDRRRLIGRANRRLHWEEMLYFKALGYQVYDFGGWYEGTTDLQKLSINRFKEEFGGKKVREFTITEHRSLRAKTINLARKLVKSLLPAN